jgi:hypothetical protein
MTTLRFNLLDVPYTLAGVPIYSRGLTLAAIYSSTWRPPLDGPQTPWSEDGHVQDCWRHADYPDHIVWASGPGELFFAHTSMTSSAPKRMTVTALAQAALGAGVTPVREAMLPLSLRVPLKGPGRLPVPTVDTRCHRFWPPEDAPPIEIKVGKVPVELRVAGTLGPTGLSVYAEAIIGWNHVTAPNEDGEQRPRKMLFTGDARQLVVPQTEEDVKRLIARVMDHLLGFAHQRGLKVDRHGHLPGRLLARSQVPWDDVDIEFAVRLPQPHGPVKYIGDYYAVS